MNSSKIGALGVLFLFSSCADSQGVEFDAGLAADGRVTDSGQVVDAVDCQPPDMILLVDRTMSMHRDPEGQTPENTPEGRATSKWSIVVNTIKALTSIPDLDKKLRFGLTLFPVDPGGEVCVTLEERISKTRATNVACEAGGSLVDPAIETAGPIAAAIDVETTRLCRSTPIGGGFETVTTQLAAIQDPIRKQFVVLLTDGGDTCDEALAIANVQALAAQNVKSYVVGFDSSGAGIDTAFLNDLACAGETAKEFPGQCTEDSAGGYTATDRDGTILFQIAENGTELRDSLEAFAGEVCCGCID